MKKWKVLDTGPALNWQREFAVDAETENDATKAYIDRANAEGHLPHSVLVFRTR